MSDELRYVILEIDQGLTVVEQRSSQPLEEVALEHGGLIVDEVSYRSYDDAYDALLNIQREADLADQD